LERFCPENKRSPKKRSSSDLERFFVPKTSVLQKIKNKKGLRRIGAFFVPKTSFTKKKKRFSPDLKRFLVPKMAQNTGLRGGKSRPEEGKIFSGAQLPPLLPTFRSYGTVFVKT